MKADYFNMADDGGKSEQIEKKKLTTKRLFMTIVDGRRINRFIC